MKNKTGIDQKRDEKISLWSIPLIQFKMKKAFQTFLVLLAVAGFYSCKSILLRASGVSKPKLETKESIITYLSENSFDLADGVFTAKDSTSFFQLITLIGSLPSIDFFNQNGELIEYSSNVDCVGQAEVFATGLIPGSNYRIDNSFQLKDIIDKIEGKYGNDETLKKDIDFTVLIYWAKYLGKMNKSVMKVMSIVQDNKKIRTRIYLINMDFQSTWGLKAIPDISLQ